MHTVIKTKYPQLIFNNIEIEHETEIMNNGHTVQMKLKDDTPMPTVQGGPLRSTYQFVQLHFHWGDNDTFGSENRIDNQTFPMELHMVFYNTKYANSAEAMEHPDGLTVLAFLYEVSEENNKDYVDFVDSLNKIHDVDTSTPIAHKESILELIRPVVDQGLSEYFTYEGSLTTPPCSEVVIWIEFSDYINLSHQQLDEFRQLSDHVGKMKHNFRPVQPINDRHVYLNCDYCDNEVDNGRGAATAITSNTITIIVLVTILSWLNKTH
ncbi:carbonic anhydrase 2-like [Chrysoperla carnea]|uniref:carbonic anhydrase 2-like n=1 Tax=Chrysoperla carnea TaxID=189513 RepID=UPI001D0838E5|nr:carbonic anhydrase 2-like [Chrysoperla carnea]